MTALQNKDKMTKAVILRVEFDRVMRFIGGSSPGIS